VTQGDVPVYELVRLQLSEVSPTPLNPRRNFGTDEDKTRFGEELRRAQLAACVAVTRAAYLALWPDHGDRIGDATHVLVNGERRFHSAVHVGLEALDFVVRDDLASSREEFINHSLKENLERETSTSSSVLEASSSSWPCVRRWGSAEPELGQPSSSAGSAHG
jgi:ParB family chromosome partitioning protein